MNLLTLHAVELAKLAYSKPEESEKVVFIEHGSTQCIVRFYEDNAVISFRGTEDIKDWVTDVKFFKTEYADIGPGMLHIGFREAYECVRTRLLYELVKRNIRNVFFASHSLGAALSVVCAKDYSHNHRFNVKGVHLFGCPRVFNSKMAKDYDAHLKDVTYRWQNCCDIVCRVPKIRYKHVGQRKYIDRNGKLYEKISFGNRLKDRALGILQGWRSFKARSFADHFIDSYMKRIVVLTKEGFIK